MNAAAWQLSRQTGKSRVQRTKFVMPGTSPAMTMLKHWSREWNWRSD